MVLGWGFFGFWFFVFVYCCFGFLFLFVLFCFLWGLFLFLFFCDGRIKTHVLHPTPLPTPTSPSAKCCVPLAMTVSVNFKTDRCHI